MWVPSAAGGQMAPEFRGVYCHIQAAVSELQFWRLNFIKSEPCLSTCCLEMAVKLCVFVCVCNHQNLRLHRFSPSSSPRIACLRVAAEYQQCDNLNNEYVFLLLFCKSRPNKIIHPDLKHPALFKHLESPVLFFFLLTLNFNIDKLIRHVLFTFEIVLAPKEE